MKKRTRIVPSLVVTASFVGVIPACAIGACGGTAPTLDGGGGDAKQDQMSQNAEFSMAGPSLPHSRCTSTGPTKRT